MSLNAQDSLGDPSGAEGGSTQRRDIVGKPFLVLIVTFLANSSSGGA